MPNKTQKQTPAKDKNRMPDRSENPKMPEQQNAAPKRDNNQTRNPSQRETR